MKTDTETTVASALDAVLTPYQKELMRLTPGERIQLALALTEICRWVSTAVERERQRPV